jgi:integron cassette protein
MPQTVSSVDALQQYIQGVMARAEHHANNVDEISLAIAGAVVWRKDGEIEVMTREGDMKNVLWVRVNGSRYALSYNHEQGCIEVRERNTQGNVLAFFTNANTAREVKQFFAGL